MRRTVPQTALFGETFGFCKADIESRPWQRRNRSPDSSGAGEAAGRGRPNPGRARADARGVALESLSGVAQEVAERVEKVGGQLLGSYQDPLGKQPVLVAILPIESVEPTPFQRDLSQAHHRKLADVLDRTGMFLDPIIAVTAPSKGFWTPNGMHRLMAMRRLGARRSRR